MSKYIIDVGDAYTKHICGKGDMLCLPVRINEFEDNWLNTNIPLTPYTEPDMEKVRKEAYEKGLADAWTAARKIVTMPNREFINSDILDLDHGESIFTKYTASEAIEKIRQYEQKQEEQIQVGDEVVVDSGKCVVLAVDKNGFPAKLLEPDGYTLTLTTDVKLPKTGRHYPQIAEVLRKMKEES